MPQPVGPAEENEGAEPGILVEVGDSLQHVYHVGGEMEEDLVPGGHGGGRIAVAGKPELAGKGIRGRIHRRDNPAGETPSAHFKPVRPQPNLGAKLDRARGLRCIGRGGGRATDVAVLR